MSSYHQIKKEEEKKNKINLSREDLYTTKKKTFI